MYIFAAAANTLSERVQLNDIPVGSIECANHRLLVTNGSMKDFPIIFNIVG